MRLDGWGVDPQSMRNGMTPPSTNGSGSVSFQLKLVPSGRVRLFERTGPSRMSRSMRTSRADSGSG